MKVWQSYIDNLESPVIRTAFNNAKIELEDETIKVIVPSDLTKEKINSQKNFQNKIRNNFHSENLKFQFIVAPESFPSYAVSETKKVFSTNEKYLLLVAKNPNVQKLVDNFKLKPNK